MAYKFKVGDRVVFVKNFDGDNVYSYLLGSEGVVIKVNQQGLTKNRYEVQLEVDEEDEGELVFQARELQLVSPLDKLTEYLMSL